MNIPRLLLALLATVAVAHAAQPDPENVKLVTDDSAEMQERDAAVKMLAATPEGAQVLLGMAAKKELPDELKSSAALALAENDDEAVRKQAATLVPLPLMKGGERIEPISKLVKITGDPKAGREIFKSTGGPNCVNCHQIDGVGKEVGPPLNTIGEKPKEALYESILAPSAQIQHGFEAWTVKKTDGTIITGIKVDDTDEKFTMKTQDGEYLDIPAAEIKRKVKQKQSLMPEGLIQTMTKQDLIDLVEFLTTQKVR
jgi:putative heme-binding domain-containing protein